MKNARAVRPMNLQLRRREGRQRRGAFNGKLTLGENTADNGGLKLAYMALTNIIGNTPVKPIAGYTPQQRFFLSYGRSGART